MTEPKGIALIVGLGNPGPEYVQTRHNVGFWLVHELVEKQKASLTLEPKFKGYVTQFEVNKKPLRVLLPNTYMNLSGQSVGAFCNFYKIKPDEIIVVHDELDLPPGTARLKMDGGDGGHNGLRDIISHLGTKQFYRLRLGIGHPGNRDDVSDYVLHRPSLDDKTKIMNAISHSLDILPDITEGKISHAMKILHTNAK